MVGEISGRVRRSWSTERRSRSGDVSVARGLRNLDMNPLRPGPAVAGGLGKGNLDLPDSVKLAVAGGSGMFTFDALNRAV